jgi:hypothetical protein
VCTPTRSSVTQVYITSYGNKLHPQNGCTLICFLGPSWVQINKILCTASRGRKVVYELWHTPLYRVKIMTEKCGLILHNEYKIKSLGPTVRKMPVFWILSCLQFAALVASSLKGFMSIIYLKLPSVFRMLETKYCSKFCIQNTSLSAIIQYCCCLNFAIFSVTFNWYVRCLGFCSVLFLMS